jgi:hypothetical protein
MKAREDAELEQRAQSAQQRAAAKLAALQRGG